MTINTAKIDQNDKPTLIAYNETTGLTEPVRVDPVFGAIEIFGVAADSNTPTTLNTAKIDGNDNWTLLGYNETTGLPEAVRCGTDGSILIYAVTAAPTISSAEATAAHTILVTFDQNVNGTGTGFTFYANGTPLTIGSVSGADGTTTRTYTITETMLSTNTLTYAVVGSNITNTSGTALANTSGNVTNSIPAYDPAAQAFFDAVAGGGTTLNTTQKNAVNQLVLDAKSIGVWSKLIALYPIVGGTANAHSWNLKDTTKYQITWTGSPTQSATGVLFNGSSQYGDSGLVDNDAVLDINDDVREFYSRTNRFGASEVDMGVYLGGGAVNYFLISYSSQFYVGMHNVQVGPLSDVFGATTGLLTVQRTASNNVDYYKNGSNVATNAATSVGQGTTNIYIGACSQTLLYSSKEFALASIRKSISSADMALWYTAVQNYQTSLSRQV